MNHAKTTLGIPLMGPDPSSPANADVATVGHSPKITMHVSGYSLVNALMIPAFWATPQAKCPDVVFRL